MAKNAKNAFRLAGPWRKFAESLQTGAIVRSLRPIPGASLRHFSRPAPRIPQTGTKNPADLRHGSRQRCSFHAAFPENRLSVRSVAKRGRHGGGNDRFPLPRFRKKGFLCVLLRNVAGTVGEMAVSFAAFPEKRPSVRSVAKRGRYGGGNGGFLCRVSGKKAFCAFCCETWPARRHGTEARHGCETGPARRHGTVVRHGCETWPARRHGTGARRTGRSGYSAMVKEMAAVLPAGSTTVRMWRPGEGARRSSWIKRVSPT